MKNSTSPTADSNERSSSAIGSSFLGFQGDISLLRKVSFLRIYQLVVARIIRVLLIPAVDQQTG